MYRDILANNCNVDSAPNPITWGQKTRFTPSEKSSCVVSVDNFSVTFHPSEDSRPSEIQAAIDDVIGVVSDVLNSDPADWIGLDYGGLGYRDGVLGAEGARLLFNPANGTHFNLSLPGKACRRAGNSRLKDFFNYCAEAGGKARRIDLALDDYEKLITPEQVEEEFHGPNAVTHCRTILGVQESKRGHPEAAGATRYLGAPSSARRLRVYDKFVESGGEIDAIRWELQERKRAAEKSHSDLINGEWGKVIRDRLVGHIDFRIRESKVKVEDRIRWEPYERLMDKAERADAYFPTEIKTMEEFEDYYKRHQGPGLALILEAHDGDLGAIFDIARYGKEHWKPKHYKQLNNR